MDYTITLSYMYLMKDIKFGKAKILTKKFFHDVEYTVNFCPKNVDPKTLTAKFLL